MGSEMERFLKPPVVDPLSVFSRDNQDLPRETADRLRRDFGRLTARDDFARGNYAPWFISQAYLPVHLELEDVVKRLVAEGIVTIDAEGGKVAYGKLPPSAVK